MKRILLIYLQILLLATVMTEVPKTTTPNVTPAYVNRSWRNNNKPEPKALRQGINAQEAKPRVNSEDDSPKRDCVCSKIYDPVCASNNESYYNLCFLECNVAKNDNVTVVHQGNCIPF